MTATASYRASGNPYVDGLLGTLKWANSNLTFSFPESGSVLGASYGYGETSHDFAPLNLAQRTAARWALDSYAAVSNLTFLEIYETSTAGATLRFALSDLPHTAWAYFPSAAPEGGDTWFNQSSGVYNDPVKGSYANVTFVHELGHALGLEHSHERYAMPSDRDSMEYSVMSYRSYIGSTEHAYANEEWGFAQSLMMYDIAAIQHIYGANYATNSGNTAYAWSPKTGEMFINGHGQGAPGANRVFQTVWDGGGSDTYSFANYTTALRIDLRPGQWTQTSPAQLAKLRYDGSEMAEGNIANALLHKGDTRSLIENAVGGSMNDTIIGNSTANALYGRSGSDRLYGGDGHDRLFGGEGADRIDGGAGSDHAFYSQATATTIKTGAGLLVDLLLPHLNTGEAMGDTFVSIENLVGSGYSDNLRGDHGGNILQGLTGNDLIYGRNGNDRLYGGDGHDRIIGGAGADRLYGGAGSDTFVFLSASESFPSSHDVICDFTKGLDRVDLRTIDANSGIAGNQAFSYIGGKSFSATACELRFDKGFVAGDIDGDGVGDLLVKLLGVSALSGSDLLL